MSAKKQKRLWKDIGTTKEKFDRDSQRSPSFDRSSVARSYEGKSQSSHSIRLSKRKQDMQKVQIRNQLQQAMKNFVSNDLHDIGVDLVAVPEQEDVQNSHMSFKKDAILNDQESEDYVELHLLNQLFNKNSKIKKGQKLKKDDFPVLKESIKNLSLNHMQVSKYIKFTLNNFKKQIYRMDQKVKQIISKLTKQLFLKTNQIAKLTLQNNQLKKQLMGALDMIEELQNINCANVSPSRLLKSRRSFDTIQNDLSRAEQERDKAFKYVSYKRNEQENQNNHGPLYHRFSQIKQHRIKTIGSIAEQNTLKRDQQGEQSQITKRQRFKKFINERHQKKSQIKKELDKQKRFDSLTDNGVTSVKYLRYSSNNMADENTHFNDKAEKNNPFSLQISNPIESKYCRSRADSKNQNKMQRLNSQKIIYPIARTKKSNNK